MSAPKHQRQISAAAQKAALLHRYPESRVFLHGPHHLVWRGALTPTEVSDTYDVLIDHQRSKRPLVFVLAPRLVRPGGAKLPHVYPANTLCLDTMPDDAFGTRLLADTVVPWTCEWLFYYECWVATGEWLGGGVHPSFSTPTRSASATTRKPKNVTRGRLESALRLSSPSSLSPDEVETLLANAT